MNKNDKSINPNGITVVLPEDKKGNVTVYHRKNGEKCGTLTMSYEAYQLLNSNERIPDYTRFLFCPKSSPDVLPNPALEVLYDNFDFKEDGKRYLPIFFQFEGDHGHRDIAKDQLLPLVEASGLYNLLEGTKDYGKESAKPKVIMASLSKGTLIGNWAMMESENLIQNKKSDENKNFNKLINGSLAFGAPMSGTPMGSVDELRKILVDNQKTLYKKILIEMFCRFQEKATKGKKIYDEHCIGGQFHESKYKTKENEIILNQILDKTHFVRGELKPGHFRKKMLRVPKAASKLTLYHITKGVIPGKRDLHAKTKETSAKRILKEPTVAAQKAIYKAAKEFIPKSKEEIQECREDLLITRPQTLVCWLGNYILSEAGYKRNDGIVPIKDEDSNIFKHFKNVDGSHMDLMRNENLRNGIKFFEEIFESKDDRKQKPLTLSKPDYSYSR
ncbi:MAG: hypothetical protein ACM3UU_02145 [Ignavibacteriales bacterium]